MMNEIWKDITEFEGYYMVSNLGRVKRIKRKLRGDNYEMSEKIIAPVRVSGRYSVVSLYRDAKRRANKYIHRIVMESFAERVDGKDTVNHINGDKSDNRLENLEWCSPKENVHHAIRTGLRLAVYPKWVAKKQPVLLVHKTKLITISFPTIVSARKEEPMVDNLLRGRTPKSAIYNAIYINK